MRRTHNQCPAPTRWPLGGSALLLLVLMAACGPAAAGAPSPTPTPVAPPSLYVVGRRPSMDSDDMMNALRDHLGRDPIRVLAQRLHKEPEDIWEMLPHHPAQLLDLAEDGAVVEAILAYMLARARRS